MSKPTSISEIKQSEHLPADSASKGAPEPSKNKAIAESKKAGLGGSVSDSVGARLQALRQKYGLSQRELARRAEVTNSTLSMIEQGKVSPSVGSLEKILQAFPISLQQFFSDSLESLPPIIPAGEFLFLKDREVDIRMTPMQMGEGLRDLLVAEQSFPPGSRIASEWMSHKGFVGGVLLQGELDIHLDGTVYHLKQGDGFNFSLNREHQFINVGDGTCRILSVSFNA